MHIIAIDCGASFIKIASIENGKIEKRIIVDTPKESDTSKLDYSIEAIRNAMVELSDAGEVIYVGMSNEMHGFVLTDECGTRLTDYISWQNTLGNEEFSNGISYVDYVKHILSFESVKQTGMPIKTGQPNVSLFNILQNSAFAKVQFYTLGDYYIKMLSNKEPYIHETNAAATGIYNILSHEWSKEIIERLGFGEVNFPRVYTCQPPLVSEISERKVIFFPSIGDQQAALLGAGLSDENTISFNFGTGAQVSSLSTVGVLSDNYQTRPFFNGCYLKTVPHIPSGRALNVFWRLIKESTSFSKEMKDDILWKRIIEEATQNTKPLMDIDMSFFSNAITSHERGAICNIGEFDFTIGNLFDSVFHQIAENAIQIIKRLGIVDYDRAIFSGGVLTKNEYLRNLIIEELSSVKTFTIAEDETFSGIFKYVCAEMKYES